MYFFTSDEHYLHKNILKYCNRPFPTIEENDEEIIKRNNEVVTKHDIVIHGGDTTLSNKQEAYKIINRLNGTHIFIRGSHDYWLDKLHHEIWERTIEGIHITVCHYAMLTWPRSHYGSWQLFGHSHGTLKEYNKEKQYDIGVDNNNFYPVSFDKLKTILKEGVKKDESN